MLNDDTWKNPFNEATCKTKRLYGTEDPVRVLSILFLSLVSNCKKSNAETQIHVRAERVKGNFIKCIYICDI